MSPNTNGRVPRVAIVGLAGYGATHLRIARELEVAGALEIAAGADLNPEARRHLPAHVEFSDDYRAMLGSVKPDITVIATPPHTHAEIAAGAASVGSDILLEKPPLVSRAEHDELNAIVNQYGVACQVGFQTLVSPGMTELLKLCAEGALGRLTSVTAGGAWVRTSSYYTRSRWAGHRRIGKQVVADGVATNPFAHVVMNVLEVVATAQAGAEPRWLDAEAYRCADISTDDTVCLRLGFDDITAVVALTLRADVVVEPHIAVRGTMADAVYIHGDRLEVRSHARADDDTSPVAISTDDGTHERTLLENLIEHRASAGVVPLLVPLSRTATFTAFLEAMIETDLHPLADEWIETTPEPGGDAPQGDTRVVLREIGDAITSSVASASLFSELGLPWSRPPTHVDLLELSEVRDAR